MMIPLIPCLIAFVLLMLLAWFGGRAALEDAQQAERERIAENSRKYADDADRRRLGRRLDKLSEMHSQLRYDFDAMQGDKQPPLKADATTVDGGTGFKCPACSHVYVATVSSNT